MDETENDDRISELPEFIVHRILSFLLSPADRIRSSVLSKKWLGLTASFPILDLDITRFMRAIRAIGSTNEIYKDNGHVRDMFFKYVEYTTSRFCEQNVSVHTFNLITMIQKPAEVDIIDKCLGLVLTKGVQVLKIEIFSHISSHVEITDMFKYLLDEPLLTYRLPNSLLSASSISSLTAHCCELPSSLMVEGVNFKSLKSLHLDNIFIDEEMIKYLITTCRLIEEINLYRCLGFKRVCVFGLQNLRKVRIDYDYGLERIDIEAPNLCLFFLVDWEGTGAPSMNLASCKKLTVGFCGYFSPNSESFPNFVSSFPYVENLILTTPKDCNNLTLSSNSIRTLVLHSQCDLDKIEIVMPNLLLFKYDCKSIISNPLVRIVESKACMDIYPRHEIETLWFQKLRRVLGKKNGFKVLKLHICATFTDVEELKANQSPLYELEHVELDLKTIKESSVYVAVVEAVLWCCRPRSLTLISDFSLINFEEITPTRRRSTSD